MVCRKANLGLALILLFSIPFSFGLSAGNSYIFHLDECDMFEANITGKLQIDQNEYYIYSNCSQTQENIWLCNCTNDWDFIIEFQPNTINNYTFIFNYTWYEETSSGGGGGGHKHHNVVVINTNETGGANETGDEQQTDDTISQLPDEAEQSTDTIGESKVVVEIPSDTTEQVEDTNSGESQSTISNNNTGENVTDGKAEIKFPEFNLPWWIVPTFLVIIIVVGVVIVIWFVFSESDKTERQTTRQEIQGMLKEVEQKRNRR